MATTQGAVAQQSRLGGGNTTTSTKRKRSEPPTPAGDPATTDTTTTSTSTSSKRPRLASTLNITASSDAKILAVVESKYDVQTHSVISSSKIQKKVTSVLRHLQPAPSTKERPRISVLRARAADAGKLISIAEIAKREMLKSGQDGTKRWYQYIALGAETKDVEREKGRSPSGRGEGKTVIEETILAQRQDPGEKEMTDDEQQQGREKEQDENYDEDDDDFEQMKTPFERAIEGMPKIRAVPVMSLFLSSIPIDELRRQYGEQASDDPADT
ncbi:hypothetical protein PG993_005086 [Apiospora rasikravindrae]|uniref:DNA/RNA-binding protein Alba-like domain-containing protein n=1 Tax=Apiospora rasikravindrae TaxID=990691 RepID=A0ABR1TEL9_9PEZI